MDLSLLDENVLSPQTREFYRQVIMTLIDSKIPFLVGGAYALGCFTGIVRDTKDIDVFVHPNDVKGILEALAQAGYKTELTDEIWLGKAFHDDGLVDVVFGSANGIATVDDEWFANAHECRLLDLPVKLIPPEEMIWSKSFIMTRDRYDGADIMHVLLKCAGIIDWQRLLRRFGPHWHILYNYFVLFSYVYPSEQKCIPLWIMQELSERLFLDIQTDPSGESVCRGTLLSTTQFVIDIEQWGFRDARSGREFSK